MRTAHALHSERTSSRGVQDGQFLLRKPPGEQERADGNKQQDNNRETDGSNSLCNGKCGAEANQLQDDERPDGETAFDALERVGCWRETAVLGEEDEFLGDAVALEGLDAHDEEEAGQNGLGDQVQNNEQRAGHGAQGHEALGEVADALFDDVVGDADGFAFVGVVFVGDVAGDAESGRVEGCLGNETVREGDTQETGHEGGDSE